MEHDEIVNEVLTKLNEHGYTSDELSLITDDSVSLVDYVETAIRDAVTKIDRCNPKGIEIDETGIIALPKDFVSLLEVHGDTWKKVVSIITEKDTPEYNIAMNEYTSPGVHSPMVFRDGIRNLKILPASSGVMYYNASYDGSGITGEYEARLVADLAASIVYKIFGQDK